MTDELVKRLRGDWCGYEVSLKAIDAMTEAADRIEQLTAELNEVRKEWEGWQSTAVKLMEKLTALTAERDRLREALEYILAECTLSDNTVPSVGAIKYAARAALKGESHE